MAKYCQGNIFGWIIGRSGSISKIERSGVSDQSIMRAYMMKEFNVIRLGALGKRLSERNPSYERASGLPIRGRSGFLCPLSER